MYRLSFFLFTLILQCQIVVAQNEELQNFGTLHLLHSSSTKTNWVGLTTEGLFRFQIGAEEKNISIDQIIAWQASSPNINLRNEAVILVDGTILRGLLATLQDDLVRVQSSLFGLVAVPKDRVAAVVLDSRATSLEDLYHSWIAETDEADDSIYLRDAQRVQGVIKSLGTSSLLKIDATQSVQIETPKEALQISVSRIAAIRFSPLLNPIQFSSPSSINLNFDDGSHVVAKTFKSTDQMLEFTTGSDLIVKAKPDDCIKQCASIYSNAVDTSDWKYISQDDIPDVRGQSDWPRAQWTYFSDSEQRSKLEPYKPQVTIVPSSRAKINNDRQWKQIVGTYRQQLLPDRHAATSDVLGMRVESTAISEAEKLKVRFVAVVDGKLVELWNNNQVDDTKDTVSFTLDVANRTEVYLLVERPNRFALPREAVFEHLRFTK